MQTNRETLAARLDVRLTAAQRERLAALAQERNCSLSDLARWQLAQLLDSTPARRTRRAQSANAAPA